MTMQDWEVGRSECCVVMMQIQINLVCHESEPTSNWSFIVREFAEPLYEEIANDGEC